MIIFVLLLTGVFHLYAPSKEALQIQLEQWKTFLKYQLGQKAILEKEISSKEERRAQKLNEMNQQITWIENRITMIEEDIKIMEA